MNRKTTVLKHSIVSATPYRRRRKELAKRAAAEGEHSKVALEILEGRQLKK
jgi:hypothetical protein